MHLDFKLNIPPAEGPMSAKEDYYALETSETFAFTPRMEDDVDLSGELLKDTQQSLSRELPLTTSQKAKSGGSR